MKRQNTGRESCTAGIMTTSWLKLWTGNVILTTAAIALSPCNFRDTTCDYSGKNLTLIPYDLPANTTKLNLTNNSISLIYHDVQILSKLAQLKELYLGYNLICNLPPGALNNLKKLAVLELHNNCLTNVDRDAMKPLNLSRLTLYGNQWNCSCGLLGLQMWLNESKVHLGYPNITTCETPEEMQLRTIRTALIKKNGCFLDSASSQDSAIAKSTLDTNLSKNMHNAALQSPVTSQNTTGNQTDGSDQSKFGKSWKFVVGVMATSICISSILVLFVKCIKWYDCLFAYHHHRLQEEPELFMEKTSIEAGINSDPQASRKTENSDQQTEVRTTIYNLSEDDDGYIEDGYIDATGFNDCEE
ncbi:leucine-rich repeat-containing protein 19-like [Heterodontus francisci]|uniref:leucine-rich repeat-containing protein 19-like n=1 Tax=Heterodontus francisci TaxID=7792 RepID=UPI00355BDFFB